MAVYNNGQVGPNFTPQKVTKSVTPVSKTARQLTPTEFTSTGGEAGGQKYTVSLHSYPERTGVDRDLQHYMVFFINVRGKSRFKGTGKTVEITPVNSQVDPRTIGQQVVSLTGAALGAAVGISAGKILLGNLGQSSFGGKSIELLGTAVTGVAGAAAVEKLFSAANEGLGLFTPDRSFRISDAIMMAVNEKPSVKYGVDYDGKDLGTLLGALSQGSFTDMMKGDRRNDLVKVLALQAARLPQGIANIIGADFALSEALQYGSGIAPNPFREQVFRNVENRTFRFDYKMFPRSPSEAQNIRNIIDKFKLHMHPELSSTNMFYTYPSTFDIAYYFNGKENTNIHRISTCVLERMSVDYGGQAWNTFTDGMPTEINMSLEFRELERLTKDRIDKEGF